MTADRNAADIALDVMESEAMLWLMSGSNHVESHLATLRGAWRAYCDAGGKSWPHSTRDYLTGIRAQADLRKAEARIAELEFENARLDAAFDCPGNHKRACCGSPAICAGALTGGGE